jgi:hypothetical protein
VTHKSVFEASSRPTGVLDQEGLGWKSSPLSSGKPPLPAGQPGLSTAGQASTGKPSKLLPEDQLWAGTAPFPSNRIGGPVTSQPRSKGEEPISPTTGAASHLAREVCKREGSQLQCGLLAEKISVALENSLVTCINILLPTFIWLKSELILLQK